MGLRDRVLVAVMTYALARVGAVVAMRVDDYYPQGKRWWVRLHEKGGKRHEMPAHHTLEAYLDAYIDAAGLRGDGKSPLFRSAVGRTGALTAAAMNRVDAWRMGDAFDLIESDFVACTVVKLGGARAFVRRHRLGVLKRAAGLKIGCDPCGAEKCGSRSCLSCRDRRRGAEPI
jgi:hypothetical protein